ERAGGQALARIHVPPAAPGGAGGGGARRGDALRRGGAEHPRAVDRDRRRAGDVVSAKEEGIHFVEVPGWPRPKGYSNGVVTTGKRALYVAGQVGWNEKQELVHRDFAGQFAQALDNVLAVVRAAGGTPESVVKMTVYVTDLAAYRDAQRALGAVWRE